MQFKDYCSLPCMRLFTVCWALVLVLVLNSSVFAIKGAESCRQELAGIVYGIKNCQYYYLKEISLELIAQKPFLFSSKAASIYEEFARKYHVGLFVINAAGQVLSLSLTENGIETTDFLIHGHNIARTYLNIDSLEVKDAVAHYTFPIVNELGDRLAISILQFANHLPI